MISAIALSFALLILGHSSPKQPVDADTHPMFVCGEKHPASAGPCATAPRAIKTPSPKYPEKARQARYEGTVILWLVIGTDGRAHDIKVARSLGMGMDENAVKAVQKWKFKPSEYEGKPVPVQINVEVNFRLY